MSEQEITITVSVPPLWSDDRIVKTARKVGNPHVAAAMRSIALEMRHGYEAERVQLLARIAELEAQLAEARTKLSGAEDVLADFEALMFGDAE